MKQCEEWSDNEDYVVAESSAPIVKLYPEMEETLPQAAEEEESTE